jgi:hypothetical protein
MSDNESALLKNGVINFFFKKIEYRSLSNFWESIIIIKNGKKTREYNSGECCFHGEKFIRLSKLCKDKNRKKDLLEYGKKFLAINCNINNVQ